MKILPKRYLRIAFTNVSEPPRCTTPPCWLTQFLTHVPSLCLRVVPVLRSRHVPSHVRLPIGSRRQAPTVPGEQVVIWDCSNFVPRAKRSWERVWGCKSSRRQRLRIQNHFFLVFRPSHLKFSSGCTYVYREPVALASALNWLKWPNCRSFAYEIPAIFRARAALHECPPHPLSNQQFSRHRTSCTKFRATNRDKYCRSLQFTKVCFVSFLARSWRETPATDERYAFFLTIPACYRRVLLFTALTFQKVWQSPRDDTRILFERNINTHHSRRCE